jgi:hypothetical protein
MVRLLRDTAPTKRGSIGHGTNALCSENVERPFDCIGIKVFQQHAFVPEVNFELPRPRRMRIETVPISEFVNH